MTSRGVKCRFPVAKLEDGYAVAVLLCNNDREHIGLLLHPSNLEVQDPTEKRFDVGCHYKHVDGRSMLGRLAFLGSDINALVFKGNPIKAEWCNLYIADRPPAAFDDRGLSLSYSLGSLAQASAPPFRIPRWLVRRLELFGMHKMKAWLPKSHPENESLLVLLSVQNPEWQESLHISLGSCSKHSISDPSRAVRWAKINFGHKDNWNVAGASLHTHTCTIHHIEGWPGLAKTFGDSERAAHLSFTPCQFAQETTLLLHLELGGSVYEKLQGYTNVRFPPLTALSPHIIQVGEAH